MTFIEQQKQLAREAMSDIQFLHGVPVELPTSKVKELDDIVAQIIANVGKELIRLAEIDKEPNVGKENKPFHHRTRHNKAIDRLITIIKEVTCGNEKRD
jgi:hypothetical protein